MLGQWDIFAAVIWTQCAVGCGGVILAAVAANRAITVMEKWAIARIWRKHDEEIARIERESQ